MFCLLPIYVYHSTVWRLWSVEKGVGFPRTGVKGGCELPVGAGTVPRSSLQEQQVLLAAEPLLQSPRTSLEVFFINVFMMQEP